ncbi:hypothetical protein Z517_00181 [Fonsecaea pedrosoi CBS 271.37]|uniref:Uncharacterized protein n=1 Tax=Fonsecaea pedrosoi CBS 271.37 TaxID=1442368 RepID=A0A0D2GUX6_9EURO|nr:uncharacterized protein Z517_00181 [Fonsecaea pedrosoi CBS 271.37]KIW84793.1 hypothetical protein Z517_00181 [Fonsecaea pedrosoi CBS 271.37]
MDAPDLIQKVKPQAPRSKPGFPQMGVFRSTVASTVASTGSPLKIRDVEHGNNDTDHPMLNPVNVRKRPNASARKDEWEDSSGAEGDKHQSGISNSPPNKGRVINKTPRFNKISKPTGEEVKELSQSRSAVDWRNRKEVEEAYRKKVCAMIDDDILDQVNAEGGITPIGRMYKAVCWMLERQNVDNAHVTNEAGQEDITTLRAENEAMRKAIDRAMQLLESA